MAIGAVGLGERLRRPGEARSLWLGETRVSFVPDGVIQGVPRAWLPDSTEEFWAAHPEYVDGSGYLVASIGGLLVESGGRALLIDAGWGPVSLPAVPGRPNGAVRGGALLDGLRALGRGPEEIEAVAFTHLHVDHFGWAWGQGGVGPVFARAEYLVAEPEWAGSDLSAQGVLEGVRVRTVADGEEVFPGVRVRVTGGHTAGHAEYVISGGGRRLIAFGDAMHSPVQADHPEWSCVYDHDRVRSAEHRRRLIAELERPDTIGFGVHFADVVFGRVVRDGAGSVWRPLDA
ncbi:MBL fold metallo-hydrolase [Nonomuraea sp. N2-4H]|jgi:glyoxylase-like metal-dependent hydrolase (beta-lactamase superfamily II)|uniref:MBL fold metallo-hydrolase n=1 Tax=unclassified Nonomuraea TaxID=2593643 RepID=UPI00324B4736